MIYGIKDDKVMTWNNVIDAANDLNVRHTIVSEAIMQQKKISGYEFLTDFSVS